MREPVETIEENYALVRERLSEVCRACGRDTSDVTVMAVTKTHSAQYVRAAIELGISHIGENRVSEGGRKIAEVGRDAAVFHAIGVLHRSEVRQAVRDFHWLDAIDDVRILEEIARRNASPGLLLEVNTSGEPSKKGYPPDRDVLEGVLQHADELGLRISGFLTVGPLGTGESGMRRAFSTLRKLRDDLAESTGSGLPVLSMGMSDDYHLAVAEGATVIRLGRALFGERE